MSPKLTYIILKPLKIQREEGTLIQLYISFYNKNERGLLKCLK